jgi:hypothetical protein
MHCIRFKAQPSAITAQVIRELRTFTSLSIAELRQRASSGQPLLEFEVFRHEWQETKRSMQQVLESIEAGRLPLTIHHFREVEGARATEKVLSPSQLRHLFVRWGKIEDQTAEDIELEEGHIQSPEDYLREPDDNAT